MDKTPPSSKELQEKMVMDRGTYLTLKAFLSAYTGQILEDNKHLLIENRLLPVMKHYGISSFSSLVQHLKRAQNHSLLGSVAECFAIHESSFFRDKKPFDVIKEKLILQFKQKKIEHDTLRIWCAGCSSGQEPYSLAFMLEELMLEKMGLSYKILATDFSKNILNRAKEGRYSQFEVQRGLSIRYLAQNFIKENDFWVVKEKFKENIDFLPFNLMDPIPYDNKFHLIFCRNVLIYFSAEKKQQVLDQLSKALAPGGYLFLGSSETFVGLKTSLKYNPEIGAYLK